MKHDLVRAVRAPLQAAQMPRITARLGEMSAEAEKWFAAEGIEKKARRVVLSLDVRYVGQNFELPVPIAETRGGGTPALLAADKIRERFLAVHTRFYGFCSDTDPIEVVNVRMSAIGTVAEKRTLGPQNRTTRKPKPAAHRMVWFKAVKPVKTPVFDRARLAAGQTIVGPAIIDQFDSTTVLYPRDRLVVDDALNLQITLT
jgi:N-methylhydantoinase A